jgi:hypothetical protein
MHTLFQTEKAKIVTKMFLKLAQNHSKEAAILMLLFCCLGFITLHYTWYHILIQCHIQEPKYTLPDLQYITNSLPEYKLQSVVKWKVIGLYCSSNNPKSSGETLIDLEEVGYGRQVNMIHKEMCRYCTEVQCSSILNSELRNNTTI